MLLNEFLKEHRKVEEQQATIAELKTTVMQEQKDFRSAVAQLQTVLTEQAAKLQKSARRSKHPDPDGDC